MDEIVKYASIITLAGAAISFLIGLIKWIDQRNRQIESKNYEEFHKMVRVASAGNEGPGTVVMQIAAIYQLMMYKKFSFAALPVLEAMKVIYTLDAEHNNKNTVDPRNKLLLKSIEDTISELNRKP